ncbi:MAG: hypothetical protein GQF41_4055 [Candidatus Rifleibacterium amylolyticum]|nr:MAG: hypothetical protein GQF41_4055 [Candidatus Rifleibacterium amylolyticum]
MKHIHFILTFTIFIFMISQVRADDFVDITLHWLQAVGNNENISEPIFGDRVYSAEEGRYIAKLCSSHRFSENSFTSFLKETEFVEKYWHIAIGVESDEDTSMLLKQHPPVIDTKKLPKDLIAKVIARRTPLLNNFVFDKTKFENDIFDPKYFGFASSKGPISYLDFVWQRLIIMMCLSKDMRFEEDINNLISYLVTPNPNAKMWLEKDKELHARLTCGGGISRVKNICIGYLNLFRKQQGKPRLNTGDESTWVDFEWSKYRVK